MKDIIYIAVVCAIAYLSEQREAKVLSKLQAERAFSAALVEEFEMTIQKITKETKEIQWP